MKNKLITITILIFLPVLSIAQENNAILCSDGIDNDNNGLIDCEEPGCINLSDNGCSLCGDGSSFADVVFEYSSGCPFSDPLPQGSLGVADYNFEPGDNPTFTFLGQGGFIKLGFTNNVLSNSGDNQDDLWVFEIGPIVESIDIAIRPLDNFTETQLQNSGIPDANSDGYYEVGNLSGATSGFDIDLVIQGYAAGELKFDAIEIKDVIDEDCSTETAGADIDAVCALFSIPSDCAGVPNGSAVIDDCGECLEPNDPNFNQLCIDCAGVFNGTALIDDCGECLDPNDPNFNQSCADCAGVPNGLAVIDDCGECHEPTDPSFNQSCSDCAGVLYGTAVIDNCGECLEPNDPNFNRSCIGEKNIYIPNAFTPDGDGLNEVFQVKGIGLQKIKLWIFNRFGEQIYYTEGVSVSWDGRGGQGSEYFAPNGVYAYRVQVHVEDAEVKELKGFVSLIR